MSKPTVAVIGAGWAGCAAAVELARRGFEVTVYEAARIPGGRARRIAYQGHTLDNGQHILLGAYRESLQMMRTVGLEPSELLLRLPLQMRYPAGSNGMDLIAARLPAPWHMAAGVLLARGLSMSDKLSLARFSSAARWMGWQLNTDCTVAELLDRFSQTERLTKLMWRPLCIAALNTPPERASAKVFLAVLRDSLGANRSASDMLLPRVNLSMLFPEAAIAWLRKHGGTAMMGARVTSITPAGEYWIVGTAAGEERYQQVVVATCASNAQSLLERIDPALGRTLDFSYEAISTCYLQYAASVRLPCPMLALMDDAAHNRWGQFVFDRGQLDPSQAGLFAVVISAADMANHIDGLEQFVALQLAHALKMPELSSPIWSKAIAEKRATFACTPELTRPLNATSHQGLWLAGDYTAGEYPATIESAVRSGLSAARSLSHPAAGKTPSARPAAF